MPKRPYLLLLLVALLIPGSARALPVTFQVRMSHQIDLSNFDPDHDFVDLAGDFNGWGNSPLTPLTDGDGDETYEITLGGFTAGQSIEFKFRMNGEWDGSEEFPGGGPNRQYTVQEDENQILVWYDNELPDTGPPLAGFEAHPRTVRAGGLVQFEDLSAGAIDNRQWSFAGGSPASSNERNPVVYYPDAGLFDVTLIVSNALLADTLTRVDYIEVSAQDPEAIAWWNDGVFHEIFVRSFHDSDGDGIGDLPGLTQKLDYLNDGDPETDTDLGITGIWLMPIQDSPSYHGYDAVDYRSINPDYGTMDDFAAFLAAAHARGIRVIIDYVMNHSSDQHPWFQQAAQNDPQYRDYYRWSDGDPGQSGPWGQQVWHWHPSDWYYGLFTGAMPDLNYETPALKQEMFDTASYWLDTVGVDGFRLDAVLYILEDGDQLQNTQETLDFWQEYNQHVKAVKPDALSVGEAWTNTATVLDYVSEDRLDLCFEFDLAYTIIDALNWSYAPNLSAKALEVYGLYPHLQFATFLTNHDQDRVLNRLGHDEAKAKTAAGIYLTLPGVPFLYYGEEIGMIGAGPHEVIRRPMQWTDGPNAGFTTGVPWNQINDNYESYNVLVEEQDPGSLLNWYKRLIALRNQEAALRRGEHFALGSSADAVLSYLRSFEGERLLVCANTGASTVGSLTLTSFGNLLPPGLYSAENLLDPGLPFELTVSEAQEIGGLTLAPHELIVLRLDLVSGVDPDDEIAPSQGATQLRNFPNPFNPGTTIEYRLADRSRIRLSIHDVAGREVALLREGRQDAGLHQLDWNGRDDAGRSLPSGVYLARLNPEAGGASTRLLLLK
jgi:alpha-amylase